MCEYGVNVNPLKCFIETENPQYIIAKAHQFIKVTLKLIMFS